MRVPSKVFEYRNMVLSEPQMVLKIIGHVRWLSAHLQTLLLHFLEALAINLNVFDILRVHQRGQQVQNFKRPVVYQKVLVPFLGNYFSG